MGESEKAKLLEEISKEQFPIFASEMTVDEYSETECPEDEEEQ